MWIFYSCLVFIFSNILYLSTRYVQKKNIPSDFYSIFLFSIPCLIFLIINLINGFSMVLSLTNSLLVLITAVFWGYLGNWFSQQGILHSRNTGYSLILQKSYVALTTILAVFLFGSSLTIVKSLGLLLILVFIFILSDLNQEKILTVKNSNKWIYFSFGAHLCLAYGSLISKYFLNIGLEPTVYLFYIFLLVSVFSAYQARQFLFKASIIKFNWGILLILGLSATGFKYFAQLGYKYAPNPGYVAAFNTASIMGVTILSKFLFNDELSKKKIVGVFGVIIGLLMLVL